MDAKVKKLLQVLANIPIDEFSFGNGPVSRLPNDQPITSWHAMSGTFSITVGDVKEARAILTETKGEHNV